MKTPRRLVLVSCAILAFTAGQAWAGVEYVIEISVDGLGGTYLNTLFNQVGNTYPIPNFERLRDEGAGTLAAHIDNNNWETLPNHVSLLTARPQVGVTGHNWTANSEPITTTIQANKVNWLPDEPHYVASVFDVAHDNGLTTGMYANKTKFSLFDNTGYALGGGSYNATNGAPDTNLVGGDNGHRKLDNTYINTSLTGTSSPCDTYIAQQKSTPMQFAFLHFNNPDSAGHNNGGWGSPGYYNSVAAVDVMLGKIFDLIETDNSAVGLAMRGKTAIILTADHGTQNSYVTPAERYSVPFYVWGPGVTAGADLYDLNPDNRQMASSYPMTTYGGIQPIRNAEASNLALALLAPYYFPEGKCIPIPGSTFNLAQDLAVPEPATMGLLALGALVAIRRRRK